MIEIKVQFTDAEFKKFRKALHQFQEECNSKVTYRKFIYLKTTKGVSAWRGPNKTNRVKRVSSIELKGGQNLI